MTLAIFILGTILGSFLNVALARHGSNLGMWGRSLCFSCGRTLSAKELVPVLSFFFLRGRCLKCKAKISPIYPVVEILSGLLLVAVWVREGGESLLASDFSLFSLLSFVLAGLFFLTILAVSVYDIRHMVIPRVWSLMASLFALLYLLTQAVAYHTAAPVLSGLLAALLLFCFFALVFFVSRGRAMGFGDAKLSVSMGLFLGLSGALSAFAVAFWSGAIFALGLWFSRIVGLWRGKKPITMKTEVPFAPFLAFGTLLSYAFDLHIFF